MFELPFKSISSYCYQSIRGLPLPACPFKLAQWYQTTAVIAGVGQLHLQINWFSEEVTAAAFKAWEMRKINYRTSGIQYVGVSVMQELLHEHRGRAHKSRFGENSVMLGGKYSPQGHTVIVCVYFSTHWRLCVGCYFRVSRHLLPPPPLFFHLSLLYNTWNSFAL